MGLVRSRSSNLQDEILFSRVGLAEWVDTVKARAEWSEFINALGMMSIFNEEISESFLLIIM